MLKTKRIIAIVLLISILFRFCFVLIHSSHECTHDDNCPICTIINKFKKEVSSVKPCLTVILISSISFFIFRVFQIKREYDKKRYSPIGLKVELIN